mmetsp:Transcript_18784/g.34801  ORF Transcript_18784/g.34801 Transcript_18784/m.34801 type:complete len:696 (+) Transcript_18784:176-2263(+)
MANIVHPPPVALTSDERSTEGSSNGEVSLGVREDEEGIEGVEEAGKEVMQRELGYEKIASTGSSGENTKTPAGTSKVRTICGVKVDLSPAPLPALIHPSQGFWGTSRLAELTGTSWKTVYFVAYASIVVCGFLVLGKAHYDFDEAARLGCHNTFWSNSSRVDVTCGVNAISCRPFESQTWYLARCPALCLKKWPEPVLGDGEYVATSRICASAIHAGALDATSGGSFEYRLAGPRQQFGSSTRNGVTSEPFGWFPRAIEFRGVEDSNTNVLQGWLDVYIVLSVAIALFWAKPRPFLAYMLIAVLGSLYFVAIEVSRETYAGILNEYSGRVFVIVLFVTAVYPISIANTFPDPRVFGLDAFLFYFLPFWAAVHMSILETWGLNLSLTSEVFSSVTSILLFVVLIAFAIPLLAIHMYHYYRAGLLWKILGVTSAAVLAAVITAVVASDYLSFHFHHWMMGGAGMLLIQGQPRMRYSIFFQSLMFGVFVDGVMRWDIDPLFDSVEAVDFDSISSGQTLFWTGVNITGSEVTLEWATPSVVLNAWACGGERELSTDSVRTNPTRRLGADSRWQSPSFQGQLSPLLDSSSTIFDGDTVPLDFEYRFALSANAVLLFYDFFQSPDSDGTFSITRDLKNEDTVFQFAIAGHNVGTSSYLEVRTLTSNETSLGAGFYNGTNSSFINDPCLRVAALQELPILLP